MELDIDASEWLNTAQPQSPPALQGRVVVVTAFQMLCPGCVQNSLPQAKLLHRRFAGDELAVVGLHSVFEHHAVMTPEALRVFAREYRLQFPIAIDRPQPGQAVPATMARWELAGTPSLLVFGRDGRLAVRHFGHLDDLHLGLVLGQLLGTGATGQLPETPAQPVCALP